MIGVNAQIKSDSGGNDGVGFSIPSDTVQVGRLQLISNGKAVHAYLGVSIDSSLDRRAPRRRQARHGGRAGRPAARAT